MLRVFKSIIAITAVLFSVSSFSVDGVQCADSSVNYDLCHTGTITKLTYKKSDSTVLISGISAPGCGTGWVLQDIDTNEDSKAIYSTLMAAHLSGREISLSRVGHGSCTKWDGDWKGVVTEVSLN